MRLNDRNYLGRYQVGQEVPVGVLCRTSLRVPTVPDAAPWVKILDSQGSVIETHELPIVDRYNQTGWFQKLVRLGSSFGLGSYTVEITYTLSGAPHILISTFEVVAGGDLGGPVIAIYAIDRPEARYVVAQLGTGRLVQGRNPSV